MGEKKRREALLSKKIGDLRVYLLQYQYALRALVKALPERARRERAPFAMLGRLEIWPCQDAAVVLMFPSDDGQIDVQIRPASSKTHREFLGTSEVGAFYDNKRSAVSWRIVLAVNDPAPYIVHLADPASLGSLGVVKPGFSGLSIFGWEASLPPPDDEALTAFRADLSAQNLTGLIPGSKSGARDTALCLLEQFGTILEAGGREEETQAFLAEHPELLYPEYIECHRKLKLGDDMGTDYVFLVPGTGGLEHVFVEIERPDKPLFVEKGYFSFQFTEAKSQLLRWSSWITLNHGYLERKLPGLRKPIFHLVMGRASGISCEGRSALQAEFLGTDRRFSSFDDVADRFRRIVDRLLTKQREAGPSGL